jgi:hypothetical protein
MCERVFDEAAYGFWTGWLRAWLSTDPGVWCAHLCIFQAQAKAFPSV